MKNKYYNDAIIGGKNITASYSKNGELLRLIYPSPDYMQFIDYFETGVKINDLGLYIYIKTLTICINSIIQKILIF